MPTKPPILAPVAQEPPAPPQFPNVQLNVLPQGLMITILLSPTTSINQMIDASTMDEVAKQWRETRKAALDFGRAVKASRND